MPAKWFSGIWLVLALFANCQPTEAQSISKNKTDNMMLLQAESAYSEMHYALAVALYEKYLEKNADTDQTASETLAHLGDCYWQMREYPLCLKTYQKLYPEYNSKVNPLHQLRIGELYARQENYREAAKWLKRLVTYKDKADTYKSEQSIKAMKQDSVQWKVNYLSFNSTYREFYPCIADSMLIFSSNRPLPGKTIANHWDGEGYARLWQIPIADVDYESVDILQHKLVKKPINGVGTFTDKKLSGVFEDADNKPVRQIVNKRLPVQYVVGRKSFEGDPVKGFEKVLYNISGAAIDAAGDIFFSANYTRVPKNQINRIRLMEGKYKHHEVLNLKMLPFGDSLVYSVMHPAVTGNGSMLVFSSDKPGGRGGYDLYYTSRTIDGKGWTDMIPLGSNINGVGNEVFPCIVNDTVLYFSSDGNAGLGGLDIYRISLANALSGNGMPEHLPYPINSNGDDFGWTEHNGAKIAYFTSDRVSSEDNIFSAEKIVKKVQIDSLPARPLSKMVRIDGYVLDRQTLQPLHDATVFLLNTCTGKVAICKSDTIGYYAFEAEAGCTVIVKAVKDDMKEDCLKAVLQNTGKDTPHDLMLDRFAKGQIWKINNIHYDFDRWNIRREACPILDSLVYLLKTYPIKIELSSHTDCRGDDAYNDRLSQKRAESVVSYMVSKGISASRIVAKGYGARHLLNRCAKGVPCSEEEHQANRRTEVKILEVGSFEPNTHPKTDMTLFKNGQQLNAEDLPSDFFDLCK
jgi:outer membrane protein OmpA-like peptidoglycan-associated protein